MKLIGLVIKKYEHSSGENKLSYIIQVKVFWVVMLCSVAVGHHCFRGPYCLAATLYSWPWHEPSPPQEPHISH